MGFFSDFATGGVTLLAVLVVLSLFDVPARWTVAAGRLSPLALFAGWGVVCLVLTIVGGLLRAPLYVGVIALLLACVWALRRVPRPLQVRAGGEGAGALRVLVVAIPYLVIAATIRVAAVDTFTYWLPNALFLHDHDIFAGAGDATLSGFPAFPQNLQLIGYIAGLALPFFPATAIISVNALLLCWLAWLLARIIADGKLIGWGTAACSILLVTALNPSYVPDLALVSYGELSTGVALAASAYAAWMILESARADRPADGQAFARGELLVFGLTLAALINIKESNPSLVGELLVVFAVLGLIGSRFADRLLLLRRLWLAVAPPAIAYAAWHGYLRWQLPEASAHGLLPVAQWQWSDVPVILSSMGLVATNKGGYFGLVLLIALYGLWLLAKKRQEPALRLTVITVLMFLAHIAFLVVVYLAVFPGADGRRVQSFWRFATQLGPLVLLTAVVIAAPYGRRISRSMPAWAAALPLVLCLVGPIAAYRFLRIDLKSGQPAIWQMGKDLVSILPPNAKLDVVMFHDNGNWSSELKGALTMSDPRRSDIAVQLHATVSDLSTASLVWLNCLDEGSAKTLGIDEPPGVALLLARQGSGWVVSRKWPAGVCNPGKGGAL